MNRFIFSQEDPSTGELYPLNQKKLAKDLWKQILTEKGLPHDTPYKYVYDENKTRDERTCDLLFRILRERNEDVSDDERNEKLVKEMDGMWKEMEKEIEKENEEKKKNRKQKELEKEKEEERKALLEDEKEKMKKFRENIKKVMEERAKNKSSEEQNVK